MRKLVLLALSAFILLGCNKGNKGVEVPESTNVAVSDSSGPSDTLGQGLSVIPGVTGEQIKDVETPGAESIQTEANETQESEEESKAFKAAIPNPKKFFSEDYVDVPKYLKSLGYKMSTHTVRTIDGDAQEDDYTFTAGTKSIHINHYVLMGFSETKVTIVGDEKALNEFYNKAKKMQGKEDWWYCKVYKKENTVTIEGGMD